mmetsp:Transcript_29116/g.34323  ORF Transcript_29116/g.34323 Transcript_29116/m.34323 type:complete len:90 (-) Transcript_29116:175-444(-)
MKVASFEHNHYGVFERSDSSEDDEEPRTKKGIRPTGNPNSRISEMGFLLGTILFVAALIFFFTQYLLKGTKSKFEEDDDNDSLISGQSR